jgi:hypothetical protein
MITMPHQSRLLEELPVPESVSCSIMLYGISERKVQRLNDCGLHQIAMPTAILIGWFPGCGRAGAWNTAHRRAAESAQADFVKL